MPVETRWTAAMLYALPDDGLRHEIVDGVHFVTPAPRLSHQAIVLELAVQLREYLRKFGAGRVFIAPADVELADDTVVEPDLFVVEPTASPLPRRWSGASGLLLVVEVTSPRTASRDRVMKRLRYQRAGIAEYWIVDPLAQLMERWRPHDERPEIVTGTLEWAVPRAAGPLRITLGELFAEG